MAAATDDDAAAILARRCSDACSIWRISSKTSQPADPTTALDEVRGVADPEAAADAVAEGTLEAMADAAADAVADNPPEIVGGGVLNIFDGADTMAALTAGENGKVDAGGGRCRLQGIPPFAGASEFPVNP